MEETNAIPSWNFGHALNLLHQGKFVQREGWNGKGMYIALQIPTPLSKMTLPYIYMKTFQGDLVPWLASQTDLLSSDWRIVEQVTTSTGPSQQVSNTGIGVSEQPADTAVNEGNAMHTPFQQELPGLES